MASTTGKTIQFFLPNGEPRGVRIAEITTRIVQAILVPRSLLSKAKERPEMANVGVYLLIGEADEAAKPMVYIGQSEDPYRRLEQHAKDESKAFWQTAVVFVSKTNSFTLTHVRWLEYHCQVTAGAAGRYVLQNKVEAEPFVTEPMKADLLDAFDTMSVLVSALGFPVFDPLPKAAQRTIFLCTGSGADGRGEYVEDGFVVFAGSLARSDVVPSAENTYVTASRDRLMASGILVEEDGKLVFKEDYQFKSPSGAAMALLGRHANGWAVWRTEDGQTLDELRPRTDETTDNAEETASEELPPQL